VVPAFLDACGILGKSGPQFLINVVIKTADVFSYLLLFKLWF